MTCDTVNFLYPQRHNKCQQSTQKDTLEGRAWNIDREKCKDRNFEYHKNLTN